MAPPIDYSMWDNIEISDDEDIECHPNIDKASLVRWRKQKIHQDREERRVGIERYTAQLSWINKYYDLMQKYTAQALADATELPADIAKLLTQFEGLPTDLMPQPLVGRATSAVYNDFVANVRRHRDFAATELAKLEKEERLHLSVDKVCHDGFDSKTMISKSQHKNTSDVALVKPDNQGALKSQMKSSASSDSKMKHDEEANYEILNPEGALSGKRKQHEDAFRARRKEDQFITSQIVYQYANLDVNDLDAIYEYLSKERATLLSQNAADEILACAFEYGATAAAENNNPGHTNMVKRYVHQVSILNQMQSLGEGGPMLFFGRLRDKTHPACKFFHEHCANTVAHIQRRSKVNLAKRQGTLKSRVDLASKNANLDILRDLPDELREAIFAEDLDLLEEKLSKMPAHEAASARKKISESNLIKEAADLNDDLDGDVDSSMVSKAPPELQKKLLAQLPPDFATAILEGDGETLSSLINSYSQDEAARVLEICKQGDFLALQEESEQPEVVSE